MARVTYDSLWLLVIASCMALAIPATALASPPQCVPILERLLPGEFHYCEAVKDWQSHRDKEGVEEATYAALWGEKRAQFDLGVYYFNGAHGVARNAPLGLAWLSLAAERKDAHYVALLASARANATKEEWADAQALLAKMQPQYGDQTAAKRAGKRYQAEMWALRDHIWSVLSTNMMDPWSDRLAMEIDGLGTVQPLIALQALQHEGDTYFQGWAGNVSVGPLVHVVSESHTTTSPPLRTSR